MTQAADGLFSFAISVHPGDVGGSPIVEKRGLDPGSTSLLAHECKVLAVLSHPNVVELVRRPGPTADAKDQPLRTFLAGRSTLADHGPGDAIGAVRTAAQLATILAEVHELGWAHGAVAAEHCIVAADGSIVLCSWRRASPITTPDAPAALADVAALVEVIAAFAPTGDNRTGPGRHLADLVASARRRPLTARRLADELAVRLGDRTRSPRRDLSDRLGRRRRSRPHRRARSRPAPRRSPRHARRRSPVIGVAVRLAVCLGAVVALWLLGRSTGGAVASTEDPAPALRLATELLRWAGLAAAVYGALVNGLTLTALVLRSAQVALAADRLGPSVLRRWATGLTSIGVLGSAIAAGASAGAPSAPSAIVHRSPIPDRPPRSTAPPTSLEAVPPTAAPPTAAPPTAAPPTAAPPIEQPPVDPAPVDPAPVVATAAPAATPASPTTWVTAPGDDLWHIAERTLAAALQRPPSNAEIGRYWQRLLATNRHHLADPTEPDLIFPGQVFDLPPVEMG